MTLGWSLDDWGSRDHLKWPPTNVTLSDLVEYSDNAGELSSGERSRGWPLVMQMQCLFLFDLLLIPNLSLVRCQ